MPNDKVPYSEFAKKVKAKYPEYANVDDLTLARKMVEKYPQYASQVEFEVVDNDKKKEQAAAPTLNTPMGQTPQSEGLRNRIPKDSGNVLNLAGSNFGGTSSPSESSLPEETSQNTPTASPSQNRFSNVIMPNRKGELQKSNTPAPRKAVTVKTADGVAMNVLVPTTTKDEEINNLQTRIQNKAALPEDVELLSTSSSLAQDQGEYTRRKSKSAVEAYINEGAIAGAQEDQIEEIGFREQTTNAALAELTKVFPKYQQADLVSNTSAAREFMNHFERLQPPAKKVIGTYSGVAGVGGTNYESDESYNARPDVQQYNQNKEAYGRIRENFQRIVEKGLADKLAKKQITKEDYLKEIAAFKSPEASRLTDESEFNTSSTGGLAFSITKKVLGLGGDTTDREQMLNIPKGIAEGALNQAIQELVVEKSRRAVKEGNPQLAAEAQELLNHYDEKYIDRYPTLKEQRYTAAITDYIAKASGNQEGSEGEDLSLKVFGDQGSKLEYARQYGKENGLMADPVFMKILEDIDNSVDKVGDSSYIGGMGKSFADVVINQGKGILDLVGWRSDRDIASEAVRDIYFPQEAPNLTNTTKNIRNIANTTAQVGGFAATQFLAGRGLSGAGMGARNAQRLSSMLTGTLTSYDGHYKEAMQITDNPAARTFMATTNAIVEGVVENIFNEAKLIDNYIPNVRKNISDIATKIGTKDFSREMATELLDESKNSIIDFGKKYAKNIWDEGREEVLAGAFSDLNKMMFGDPDMNVGQLIENAKETFIQTAIGTAVVGAWGAHADRVGERNSTYKKALYDAAVSYDATEDAFRKGMAAGMYDQNELNSKLQILNTAQKALGELPRVEEVMGKQLGQRQRQVYVANRTAEAVLQKQLEGVGENELARTEIEGKIERLKEQRNRIFGEDLQFDEAMNEVPATPVEEVKVETPVQETVEKPTPQIPAVSDVIGQPVVLNGVQGTLEQDGQRLIFREDDLTEEGRVRERDLGNIEEISASTIDQIGLSLPTPTTTTIEDVQVDSVVDADENGNLVIRGNTYINRYTDPMAAITRDNDGNVVNVTLETEDGKKRTFRGRTAEDAAYQITLQQITKDNAERSNFEEFLNSDETQSEIQSVAIPETTEAASTTSAETVQSQQSAEAGDSQARPAVSGNQPSINQTVVETDEQLEARRRKRSQERQNSSGNTATPDTNTQPDVVSGNTGTTIAPDANGDATAISDAKADTNPVTAPEAPETAQTDSTETQTQSVEKPKRKKRVSDAEIIKGFTPEEKKEYTQAIIAGDVDRANELVKSKRPADEKRTGSKKYTKKNLAEVADDTDGRSEREVQVLNDAKRLVRAMPDASVTIHEDKESYSKAVQEAGGTEQNSDTSGFYISDDGEQIHINMENATPEVVFHEGAHPLLDKLAEERPEVINNLYNQLEELAQESDLAREALEFGDSPFYADDPVQANKEAIVQFMALVADNNRNLQPSLLDRIKTFVDNVLASIGIPSMFRQRIADTDDIRSVAAKFTSAIQYGREMRVVKSNQNVGSTRVPDNVPKTGRKIDFSFTTRDKKMFAGIKRADISEFAGKTIGITASDRLSAGTVSFNRKSHKVKGGIFYPLIQKNFIWASSEAHQARVIIDDLVPDKDGYVYMAIMSMGRDSHMSNYNSLLFVNDLLRGAIEDKKVTKKQLVERVNKAAKREIVNDRMSLDNILKSIEQTYSVETGTFDERKPFLQSLLGGVKETKKPVNWAGLPTYLEATQILAEPALANAINGDIVSIIRTKKESLRVVQTSPETHGEDFHESYPFAIEHGGEIEYTLLNEAAHVSDVMPEFKNKGGKMVRFSDYVKALDDVDLARRRFTRQVMLSDPKAPVSATQGKRKVQFSAASRVVGEHEGIPIRQTDNSGAFRKALQDSVSKRPADGLGVEVKSVEDYNKIIEQGGKLFLSEDGMFGGMLGADGYIGSLFRNPESNVKGVSKTLLDIAVTEGGKFLDAFATLEGLYMKSGFRPVARLKFDESQAPEGWDAEGSVLKNKPDNVFMAYDPNGKYAAGEGFYTDDYDAAYAAARDFAPSDALGVNKTGTTQGFFSDVVSGKSEKFKPKKEFTPVLSFTGAQEKFKEIYDKFKGNFDTHIATSIPTFRELQVKVGDAIAKTFTPPVRNLNPEMSELKQEYNSRNNVTTPQVGIKKLSVPFMNRVADFHDTTEDDRNNPEVIASYRAFMEETKKMYEMLVEKGYRMEPYLGEGEPYGVDSDAVRRDIQENKHLFYLMSRKATGQGETDMSGDDYILFENTGIELSGQEVVYNDLFRAVHDVIGHGMQSNNTFSSQGEFNAYLTHSNMYSPLAQKALFLETVSYNAWYNNGKHLRREDGTIPKKGDPDYDQSKYGYAPRKLYVVPDEFIQEARRSPLIYDIGGSEGGFVKAITSVTGGNIRSINLDVNPDMREAHNRQPVEGSQFVQQAYYEGYTDEDTGITYPRHIPQEKADVVHESMVFQFISPEREQFIKEAATNYLREDGVLMLEEKLLPATEEEWRANEAKKDAYKLQYYPQEAITEKAEQVLVGMKANQTSDSDLLDVLNKNFKYVSQYWDSGNFKGYMASNDRASLSTLKNKIGDTTSEFTTRGMLEFENGKPKVQFSAANRMSFSERRQRLSDLFYQNLLTEEEFNDAIDALDEAEEADRVSRQAASTRSESGNTSSVKNKSVEEKRKELNVGGASQKQTRSDADVRKMADDAIRDGFNVRELIDDVLENSDQPSDVEIELIGRYVAGKEAEIRRINEEIEEAAENGDDLNPLMIERDRAVAELNDAYNAARSGGTETARALRYRRQVRAEDESLAAMFLREAASSGVNRLTPEQIEKITQQHKELMDAKTKYEKKIRNLEAQNRRLRADKNVQETKRNTSKKQNKTKEDFKKERLSILEEIKKKWKQAGNDGTLSALPLPYVKQLAAITPDVTRLVRSLVEEGVTNLSDIIDSIHTDIKGAIPEITKDDVLDIIAGDYRKPKETRDELAQKIFDLKKQAQLHKQLEDLRNNVAKAKTPQQKINWSREVQMLQKQINDFRKTVREAEQAQRKQEEADAREKRLKKGERAVPEQKALDMLKARTKSEIERLEKRIANKDYDPDPDVSPLKLDKEAIDLRNALIKKRKEIEVEFAKQEIAKKKWWAWDGKAVDLATEVLNIPRTLMASMDFSAPLRQGITLTFSHPVVAFNPFKNQQTGQRGAFWEMFSQAFSEARYDRWLADLQESPIWSVIEESKLYVANQNDPTLKHKEERFMSNLIQRVPYLGGLIGISERAYSSYLNKMRVDIFMQGVTAFQADGKTVENSKDLYRAWGKYINNATGRGHLGKLEEAAQVLNSTFFSPRLIASRVALINPLYYAKMPPEVRSRSLKDMAAFATVGSLILGLTRVALGAEDDDEEGVTIEIDPRSTDFAKIKFANSRWDIWGGFQQYIRFASQMVRGEVKTVTGNIQKIDGETFPFKTRWDGVLSFFRGKLAPVPALAVNMMAGGEDILGEKLEFGKTVRDYLLPMVASDAIDASKELGWVRGIGLMTVPAMFGVGTSTYLPRANHDVVTSADKIFQKKGASLLTVGNKSTADISKYVGDSDPKHPEGKMTDEEWGEFGKRKAELLSKKVAELQRTGVRVVSEAGHRKTIRLENMSTEQIKKLQQKLTSEANEVVKEKMFGKPKESKKKDIKFEIKF